MHSFDPKIAAIVGVNAAVIYQNFLFWSEKNKANKKHIRDGYVWTYNSRRALLELFPYFTESQIKTAIAKLIASGLLVKGDYNLANYDKTNWYAVSISAHWLLSPIGQKSPMDQTKIANGLDKNRQPIPDNKPDIKPDRIPPLPPKGGDGRDSYHFPRRERETKASRQRKAIDEAWRILEEKEKANAASS